MANSERVGSSGKAALRFQASSPAATSSAIATSISAAGSGSTSARARPANAIANAEIADDATPLQAAPAPPQRSASRATSN